MEATQAYESDQHGGSDVDPQGGPQPAAAGLFAACEPLLFADAIVESDPHLCRFLFAYGELPVIGKLRPGPHASELRLLVMVGRLPYSVESREQREKMLTIVRSFPTETGTSLVVTPDQSICVSSATTMPLPLTPAGLLTELVVQLFHLEPVLRSLADILPDLAPALGSPPAAEKVEPRV